MHSVMRSLAFRATFHKLRRTRDGELLVVLPKCKICGWVLEARASFRGPYDNHSCYRRRALRQENDRQCPGTPGWRIATCTQCQIKPVYRDVCITHLFIETKDDLMRRWCVSDSAVVRARRRYRPRYRGPMLGIRRGRPRKREPWPSPSSQLLMA